MQSGARFWRGLCLLTLLCARLAAAQGPDEQPPASGLQRAQEHFRLGLEFYRSNGYREALREFEAALALAPSADIWFNIGRAHQQLGDHAQAIQAFERYLRDRVDAPDAAAVRAQIQKLGERVAPEGAEARAGSYGSLRVYHAASATRVFVDGRPLAHDALDAPVLLAAGKHRFDVLGAGHVPLHAQVDIQPGLLTAAYADLRGESRARTRPASHGLTFALLGVAAAGAIVSGTFGVLSAAQQADGRTGSAEAWGRRADVALAGTALCALVAGIVYLAAERGPRTELLPAAVPAH